MDRVLRRIIDVFPHFGRSTDSEATLRIPIESQELCELSKFGDRVFVPGVCNAVRMNRPRLSSLESNVGILVNEGGVFSDPRNRVCWCASNG